MISTKFKVAPLILSTSFFLGTLFGSLVSAKELSSEKFSNLTCANLNFKTFLNHIDPRFSHVNHHLPIKNYNFNFGFYSLANCWSLAHLQRLYFYLQDERATSTEDLADSIRGFSISESPKNTWFQVEASPKIIGKFGSSSWHEIEKGYLQKGKYGTVVRRTLQSETEAYQIARFHDLKNIEYLTGDIPRTPVENQKTLILIQRMLAANLLPMILLRPQYFSQHVVVAKRIINNKIFVYDSNTPEHESEIYYNDQNGFYYAPQVIKGLPMVTNEFAAVGIFVVDSQDLLKIREVLYQDLKTQCETQ